MNASNRRILTFITSVFILCSLLYLSMAIFILSVDHYDPRYMIQIGSRRFVLSIAIPDILGMLLLVVTFASLSIAFFSLFINVRKIWEQHSLILLGKISSMQLFVLSIISSLAFVIAILARIIAIVNADQLDHSQLYILFSVVNSYVNIIFLVCLILILVSLVLLFLLFVASTGFKEKETKTILGILVFFFILFILILIFEVINVNFSHEWGIDMGIQFILLFLNFGWLACFLLYLRRRRD